MFQRIIQITSNRLTIPIRNISIYSSAFKNSSIDEVEYQRFQSLADLWWNKEGIAKLAHNYNKVRVPFIVNNLKDRGILDPKYVNTSTPLKNISIADIGCGGGILTEALAELGANVSGIDINETLINVAKNHARQNENIKNEINYILAEVESLGETHGNKYDSIVSSECIEHIADGYQESFLEANIKLVRPGGSVFITTMNKTFKCWFLGIILAENIFNAIPKGSHQWKKFLTPAQINAILEKNNCVPQVVHGFHTNFLTKTWKFNGRNDKIFYGIHAIKKSNIQ